MTKNELKEQLENIKDLHKVGIGTCPNCHTIIDNSKLQIEAILDARDKSKQETLKKVQDIIDKIEVSKIIKLLEWIYGDEDNPEKSEDIIYQNPKIMTKDVYKLVQKVKKLEKEMEKL